MTAADPAPVARPLLPTARPRLISSSGSTHNASQESLAVSQSGGSSLGSPSGSLARALAKAEQAKQLKAQKNEDLRVAAEWNDIFKSAFNRRDPEKLQRFWAEIKIRLIRKFGTIHHAFKSFDVSGDNGLSFLKFGDMLRLTTFPLDQRISRELFEKASGGDHKLSMEELKYVLMQKTIAKLVGVMQRYNDKQDSIHRHIQHFLGHLASSNTEQRKRAVDRFQLKLTVDFCRQMFQTLMRQISLKGNNGVQDIVVGRAAFAQFINEMVNVRFQAHDVPYLMNIFDHIDCHSSGSVGIAQLVITILLLSLEADRCKKLMFLFELYDADLDGCLFYGQILAMFQCICAQRAFVDGTGQRTQNLAFQEVLAAQEGLRAYESTYWLLKRVAKVDSDVVAKSELWDALERQPQLLSELFPATIRVHWAMPPAAPPEPEEPPEHEQPPDQGGAEADPERPKVMIKSRTDTRLQTWFNEPVKKSSDNGSSEPGKSQKTQGLDQESGFPRRASMQRTRDAWAQNTPEAGPVTVSSPSAQTEASVFRQSVTRAFQHSLRSFGDRRLAELTAGFNPRVDLGEDSKQLLRGASSRSLAGLHAQTRPLSGGAHGQPMLSPLQDPMSRPVSEQRSRDAGSLARVNSAPVGTRAQSGTARTTAASKLGSHSRLAQPKLQQRASRVGSQYHRDLACTSSSREKPLAPPKGPGVDPETRAGLDVPCPERERWGPEAADRFRLFCEVKSSFGRHTKDARIPTDGDIGTKFKCLVCLGKHTMTESCC